MIKKLLYLVFFTLLISFVFSVKTFANTLSVETVKTTLNGTEIKVISQNKINKLIMYKKVGTEYIKFFVSKEIGYNEKLFFIPKSILSTENNTDIKVKVIDQNGEETQIDTSLDKLKPLPSMDPKETEKPSWSPQPIPTKPTPSASIAPSSTPESSNPQSSDNNQSPNLPENSSVTAIALPFNTKIIKVGEEFQLTPAISPSYAKTTLKYSTNNVKVATIDSKGIVKGVSKGTAIIKVTTSNGLSTICVVTVTDISNSSSNSSNNNEGSESNNSSNNNNSNTNNKKGEVKAEFSPENKAIIENHLYDFDYYTFRDVIAKYGSFENYTKSIGGIYADYYGKTIKVRTYSDLKTLAEYVWGYIYMYGFDYLNGGGTYWMWGDGKHHSDDSFYPGTMKFMKTSSNIHQFDKTISGQHGDLIMTTECGPTVSMVYNKVGIDIGKMMRNGTIKYIPKLRNLQPGDKFNFFGNAITNKTPATNSIRNSAWKNGQHVAMVGEVLSDKIVLYDGGSYYQKNRKYKRVIKKPRNDAEEYESVLGYKGWSAERVMTLEQD